MSEVKGRCPLCINHRAMGKPRIHLTCERKSYTFPFRIYHCPYHGYFVWRGKKHQLVDFSKLKHQAKKVESLPPESPDTNTIADYSIVKMKCPHCGGEWRQYDKTWTTQTGGVICPCCGAEIPKEKAV